MLPSQPLRSTILACTNFDSNIFNFSLCQIIICTVWWKYQIKLISIKPQSSDVPIFMSVLFSFYCQLSPSFVTLPLESFALQCYKVICNWKVCPLDEADDTRLWTAWHFRGDLCSFYCLLSWENSHNCAETWADQMEQEFGGLDWRWATTGGWAKLGWDEWFCLLVAWWGSGSNFW